MANIVALDGKVTGVLLKNKDGTQIPADEFIVFRPQDTAFVDILPAYRQRLVELGAEQMQLMALDHLIEKIHAWRAAHPERCKVADCAPGETPVGW